MTAIAAAGRRIDAPGAETMRFPLQNVARVRQSVRRALESTGATIVVCSAANGADLITAESALEQAIPIHIVLPFAAEEFKRCSVVDRPGDWGPLFERIVAAANASGTLTTLSGSPGDDSSYLLANHTILDVAARESGAAKGLIIWDGLSRGDSDITASFADEAKNRGMQIQYILTAS